MDRVRKRRSEIEKKEMETLNKKSGVTNVFPRYNEYEHSDFSDKSKCCIRSNRGVFVIKSILSKKKAITKKMYKCSHATQAMCWISFYKSPENEHEMEFIKKVDAIKSACID